MKKLILSLAFITVVGGARAATQFVSVRLEPAFSYEDIDKSCVVTQSMSRWLTFTAAVEDGVITEAKLRDSNLSFPNSIVFEPAEMKGLEVTLDEVEEYRIVKLPLSARLLNWMFFNIDGFVINGPTFCRPPQALRTLTPNTHVFKFMQNTASEFYTAQQRFSGDRADGNPYAVRLGFKQKPHY